MTMRHMHFIFGLAALLCVSLLSPTAASAGPNDKALDATVARIFAPYKLEDSGKAIWDQPFFSASTRSLITQWKRSIKSDEFSDLSTADWLCQCQDYDFSAFKVIKKQYKSVSATSVRAAINMDIGFNEKRKTDLILILEKGRWEIDDVINADFPKGVKSALRGEIAEAKKR